MPKIQMKCSVCGIVFERHLDKDRSYENVCCSKQCLSESYKTRLKGQNNPNYKDGTFCKDQFCKCGNRKDYRAKNCTFCTRKLAENCENLPIYKRAKILIPREKVISCAKESDSFLKLSQLLGVSRQTAFRFIKEYEIDISHFRPGRGRFAALSDVLKNGSIKRNGVVKALILRHNLLPYICSICGQEPEWFGKILVLELDHCNGVSTDNGLDNLRFLCPNCHSQTETSKGKNSKGRKKKRNQNE